ncbi:RelA/SpoT domain-containing protein [Mycolicibacterium phlei]|jgi:predicted RNase H-like nuclease|uniref:GTP pyrophosphokinase n=1 Tax=Mycolicibacterium phlei DSM 43239 = CCUG 21000 TaxID=1226750 RepID=A0A5N5UUT6_MYCPH|nr:DUF429 domain-containing protein [Mycolicibacterium phlei]VEG07637.1 RelA/SpoT domain-containing protein [Mycobacteroides chelonae]AMO59507.1 hypothetical protein MPHLCCUG_00670 [Mycolicibacterium phlei]EID12358.1 RelA/SpoT domain-containing protein [Mycolicibacterium phlei RIVM601174]KAB7753343.1 GTP pyrophosphokinase [Mycolicibacterium phlei DSM 43239 = CCUG 21000]KXW62245.1 GTP pyrophosphokinase [Mycolicibacterium phlei DSM 43239 = CCUG 21000]
MHFVGLDLAWGERNPTGVAVLDADGRLRHLGTAGDDASILAALAPFTAGDCLVAIDAPLIVPNRTGHRPAEREFNRVFARFHAGARPAFADKPELADPRAARLARALDLDIDPSSASRRRAAEVYPHPATVVLFGLDKTLKYKRGAFADRRTALLRLITLIEGLEHATPALRLDDAWAALHQRVRAATRPSELRREEDPVDAVLCAYVALFWHHRPHDVTVYGDHATGYLITPSLPPGRAAKPSRTHGD